MVYLLLGAGQLIGLVVISVGSPGGWLQLATLAVFAGWTGFSQIGVTDLSLLLALVITGEVFAALLHRPPVARGVRTRLAAASLAGGVVGSGLGLALPLLGSMFGAAAFATIGALLGSAELRRQAASPAPLAGLIVTSTVRATTGVVIVTFILLVLT